MLWYLITKTMITLSDFITFEYLIQRRTKCPCSTFVLCAKKCVSQNPEWENPHHTFFVGSCCATFNLPDVRMNSGSVISPDEWKWPGSAASKHFLLFVTEISRSKNFCEILLIRANTEALYLDVLQFHKTTLLYHFECNLVHNLFLLYVELYLIKI